MNVDRERRGTPERPLAREVSLEPSKTALLVMDICDPLCLKRPSCVESVPAVQRLLGNARQAGALVVHTLPPFPSTPIDEVAPVPGESTVSAPADKFFESDLVAILAGSEVETVLLAGTSANGAILYTAFSATVRGMAVVVAEDTLSADEDWIIDFSLWQLLHQPGMSNATNEAPEHGRVTVSAVDLVEFTAVG